MVEKSKKFYGDLSAIEDFAKYLRGLKVSEDEIMARIGENTYLTIYKDKKKPKRSLAEDAIISADGAMHDPLYFNNNLDTTPSGLRYNRDITLQLIRHMRANEATDHQIAEVIGSELFELLGKKKEKKEEKDSGSKKSRFSWFRK